MNYKEEPYPENIASLHNYAEQLANEILEKLKTDNCPSINQLYLELHKTCGVQPEFSIVRDKKAFNDFGYVPNIKSGKAKSKNELKGLYIFGENTDGKVTPVYIGISRSIYKRLRNHAFGKLHNQCSLAYLMAKHDNPDIERANIHKNFQDELNTKKDIIQNYKVVLIPVKKDYDLYFLEVALAGILKTKWNSFRTH